MNVLYCHDNFYTLGPDGDVWSPGQFPYDYFTTFLECFDRVTVAGRGGRFSQDVRHYNRSSGPGVSFELFPNMNSPQGLLAHSRANDRRMAELVSRADAVIVRATCDLSWLAYKHAKRRGKPIAMEMAACAWDATYYHGSTLAKLYAPIRYLHDRIIAANADSVIYVSRNFLQRRYPAKGTTAVASNVQIDRPQESVLRKRLDRIANDRSGRPLVVGLIGTLTHKLKGIHTALDAMAMLESEGGEKSNYIFRVLGPGNPSWCRAHAERDGLAHKVFFDGTIQSGQAVLEWLDDIDIYIQPSFQEGVPRAMIEAMSRACPVIGSTTGGIPELLDPWWLHKPGDVDHLASLLELMMGEMRAREEAAMRNFTHAFDYSSDKLVPVRQKFWKEFAALADARCSSGADCADIPSDIRAPACPDGPSFTSR
ncbi:MAG: glycosyltransferase [Alphaproteobacteria bacterium]|nr:glycosyltransferase [Alphaproteobacteria bacterium]